MQPFSIQCTTCRRSLRVVNPEAIGQILSCPKCGSMVLIEAPPGWTLDSPDQVAAVSTPVIPLTETAPPTVKPSPPPPPVPASVLPSVPVAKAKPLAHAAKPAPPAATTKSAVVAKSAASVPLPKVEKVAAKVQPPATPSVPPVASLPPKPESVVHLAAAGESTASAPWPKWFLPGLGACVALGVLLFIVRLVLQPGDETQPTAMAAPRGAQETSVPAEIAEKKATIVEPSAKVEPLPQVADAEPPSLPETDNTPAIAPQKNIEEKIEAPEKEVPRTAALPNVSPLPEVAPRGPPPAVAVEPKEPAADIGVIPDAPAPPATPQSLHRIAPKRVDLSERLHHALPAIEIRSMPLVHFARLVGDLVGTPISLDIDDLTSLGQSAATPVSLEVKDVTYGQALESALESLNLGYHERDGLLILGSATGEMRKTRYRIPDLASDPADLAKFATLVERFVVPMSWRSAGGEGVMGQESDALLIDQTPAVHGQILAFCEKLRVARSLPIKSKFPASRFELTSRREKAAHLLNRSVTANFASPVSLAKVVHWLEGATGATILVDHASLAHQGTSADSEGAVVAVDQSFAATLDRLLGPMELTWRAIDEKTVEITTPEAAAEKMEVEFYPAANLAPDAAAGDALVQSIRTRLDPTLWGESPTQCSVYYDSPSRSLIVRAPQAVQSRVQAFLSQ